MDRVKLTKEDIDLIFRDAKDEGDAAIALYNHVFGDLKKVESIEKWPTVSQATAAYIFECFSKLIDPVRGGVSWLWFNKGFSTLAAEKLGVGDEEVDISTCNIKYLEGA
jgi:hypothetical protein